MSKVAAANRRWPRMRHTHDLDRRTARAAAPALRLVSPDYCFDAEALAILCTAYDRIITSLGAGQPDADREAIATRLIEAAARGQRDPDELCRAVCRQGVPGSDA
jgi:hypothetical protein